MERGGEGGAEGGGGGGESEKRYRIPGKLGGGFNLAVWRTPTTPPNLISTKLTSAISARKNYVMKFCFAIANRQI